MSKLNDYACVIEKWTRGSEAKRLRTVWPAFSDLDYAMHQVEQIVLSEIMEQIDEHQLNDIQAQTALDKIKETWTALMTPEDLKKDEIDEEGLSQFMHKHPNSKFVYVINKMPLLTETFKDAKRH